MFGEGRPRYIFAGTADPTPLGGMRILGGHNPSIEWRLECTSSPKPRIRRCPLPSPFHSFSTSSGASRPGAFEKKGRFSGSLLLTKLEIIYSMRKCKLSVSPFA